MATPAAIPLRHDRAMTFGGPRHVAAIFLPAQYQKILYEFLLAGIQTTETSNDPAMMGKAGFRKESDDARHDERLDDGGDGSVWHRHSAADHSVDRCATQVSAHLKNFAPYPPHRPQAGLSPMQRPPAISARRRPESAPDGL